jgi:biopolymer transport protein ExbB/TolQ
MEPISISPLGLYLQAGPVGKAVMITLLATSLWCWMLIFVVAVSIWRLRRAVRSVETGKPSGLVTPVLVAGADARRIEIPGESIGEIRARLQETMNRAARVLIGRLEAGLPNLAVISSVAPFIGLFGTVWGIMTSFAGIAEAKDTSLAVVAPGIAEALAATAMGLLAAIPASIGYSRLGSAMGGAAGDLANLIEERSVTLMLPPASASKETV